MTESPSLSLDQLWSRAVSGDERSRTRFFEILRVRFGALSKRRVRPDDVEDVVQDAIRIVHEKLPTRSDGTGVLPFALLVLRNVIGNYYRRQKSTGEVLEYDERVHRGAGGGDESFDLPGEADLPGGLSEKLAEALDGLALSRPRCGRFFRVILESLEDGEPREATGRILTEFPELTRSNFYVALHRCREQLRELLAQSETESVTR